MRLLHTMLRVKNLDESLVFYRDILGMQLLSQQDFPEGKFTLAFVGYGPSANNTVLELTYNWDREGEYDIGDGFGHIAVEVDDIYQACKDIEAKGGIISRQPGPMKHGTTVIAFAKDPDGYAVELIGK